jgi:hypothetical protein
MGDDAQDLHRNPHMRIDPRGVAASIDALGERPYVAVGGMHDIIEIGPLHRRSRDRGGQRSQCQQERQQAPTHEASAISPFQSRKALRVEGSARRV